jgi:hypothetical protein
LRLEHVKIIFIHPVADIADGIVVANPTTSICTVTTSPLLSLTLHLQILQKCPEDKVREWLLPVEKLAARTAFVSAIWSFRALLTSRERQVTAAKGAVTGKSCVKIVMSLAGHHLQNMTNISMMIPFLTAPLRHPNIFRAFESGVEQSGPWLAKAAPHTEILDFVASTEGQILVERGQIPRKRREATILTQRTLVCDRLVEIGHVLTGGPRRPQEIAGC